MHSAPIPPPQKVLAFVTAVAFAIAAAPLFVWWSRIRFSCPLDLVVRSFGLGLIVMFWVVMIVNRYALMFAMFLLGVNYQMVSGQDPTPHLVGAIEGEGEGVGASWLLRVHAMSITEHYQLSRSYRFSFSFSRLVRLPPSGLVSCFFRSGAPRCTFV